MEVEFNWHPSVFVQKGVSKRSSWYSNTTPIVFKKLDMPMSSPTVSVLMTAYNREQYIAEAIESVLASTFSDFELIIVDDASTDNTVEIARRYLGDPRVQVHINEKNLGDYPNRNQAASFAQGKYLKYLDSDDRILPHGLEIMVQAMKQFPEAALGIGRPPSPESPYPIQVQPEQAYREHFLGKGFLTAAPGSCIIQTNAFRSLGGFSGKRYIGDMEMWLRIAAQYPVVKMACNLVRWRKHPGQEYHQGTATMAYFFLQFHVSIDALTSQLCPLSDIERDRAIDKVKYGQARLIWRLALRERHLRTAFRLYRDASLSPRELVRGLRRPPV